MTDEVRIELQPLGEHLKVPRGTPLREILFDYGVEFPCGGRGQCRGCRIRVAEGSLEVTPPQRQVLRPQEIEEGWRLSCQCRAEGDMRLEMAQWKADILVDDSLFEFSPGKGLGIAIDLGTTTVVVQLLDLETGRVLGVRTALNAQARHGADVMSRVEFAVSGGGRKTLTDVIRHQIGTLIRQVLAHSLVPIDDKAPDNGAAAWRDSDLTQIVIVGNTVIHHLFCGIDPEPLSHYPFEPMEIGLYKFQARDLGWDLESNPVVRFLPCLGGFVGADTLAGILAIRMHESRDLVGLVDLGTNGEIVFGNSERMICASTAAGPAFEGARIWMGMRAATGAVYQVQASNGGLHCSVLGNTEPRGICGSGLVDAIAVGLDLGRVAPGGKLNCEGEHFVIADPVAISQTDVRQLQLAKAAIAAGIKLVLERIGGTHDQVKALYLAGAFGNYISRESARRIGLIEFPIDKVRPAGNTALLGAKMALFQPDIDGELFPRILERMEHMSLSADPHFMDTYVEEMVFPRG